MSNVNSQTSPATNYPSWTPTSRWPPATLVTTSQLNEQGVHTTPEDTYPVAVDEVHLLRAKRLAEYFQDEIPEDRFYMLCLAKGYDEFIPRDPPWIDEAKVLGLAAGVADPRKAGIIKTLKGKTRLIANPELDARWEANKPELPKTDFTPNRLEGTPIFEPQPAPTSPTPVLPLQPKLL